MHMETLPHGEYMEHTQQLRQTFFTDKWLQEAFEDPGTSQITLRRLESCGVPLVARQHSDQRLS